MAFPSNTLVINVGGVDKTLNRINEGGYRSEYFLREATGEIRVNIRHTRYKDKARSGLNFDRHNVEISQQVFPVAPSTEPTHRKAYFVLETQYNDAKESSVDVGVALAGFLTEANVGALVDWAS